MHPKRPKVQQLRRYRSITFVYTNGLDGVLNTINTRIQDPLGPDLTKICRSVRSRCKKVYIWWVQYASANTEYSSSTEYEVQYEVLNARGESHSIGLELKDKTSCHIPPPAYPATLTIPSAPKVLCTPYHHDFLTFHDRGTYHRHLVYTRVPKRGMAAKRTS